MATHTPELAAVINQHRLKVDTVTRERRLKIEQLNQALREGKVTGGRQYLAQLAVIDSEYHYEIHKLDIWCWQEIYKLKA